MTGHLGTHALAELERALDEVRDLAAEAAGACLGRGSDIAVMQLAETASDVVAASRSLAAAQRVAAGSTSHVALQLEALSPDAEWIITEQTPELEELRIIWKGWFFFVRALCDNVYRLLLASAEGRPAKRGGSMAAAQNPRNPVALTLAERAPDFMPWFIRFRDLRNEVKEGVNFGFTALGSPGIAVTFNTFRLNSETGRREVLVDSTGDRKVTLLDAHEGARMLAQVLSALRWVSERAPR